MSRVGIGTLKYEASLSAQNDNQSSLATGVSRLTQSIEFLTEADLDSFAPRTYLVKELIGCGDFACLVAAPGVGKSLIAPYLARCIATGESFFKRKVKKGLVWYIPCEDQHGMAARMKALSKACGPLGNFELVSNVSDLITQENSQLSFLIEKSTKAKPALIVIDTLAMAFPGIEENSSEAMSRVVTTCRRFTDLGIAVLLIHHDTKAGTQGLPRGHSVLNGALDVSIYLKKGAEGIVQGSLSKNRNGSADQRFAFRIETKQVGLDEDGDPIHAAYCQEVDPSLARSVVKLTNSGVAALKILLELSEGNGWVTEATWRKKCVDGRAVSGADAESSRRKATDRAVKELAQKQKIEIKENKVRIRPSAEIEEAFA